MLFNQYFNLKEPENGFEFFNIDVFADTKRFVDPYSIQRDTSYLGREMSKSINIFMYELLLSIRTQNYSVSRRLCSKFGETKGTRLGYSLKRIDGHGAGDKLSKDFVDSLYASLAVTSGAVKYLEESMFVCEGIDKDIISDITISIVKQQLITFTQNVCRRYGIPLKSINEKISYYCNDSKKWKVNRFELPHVVDNDSGIESYIILVPERIVPAKLTYNYRYFYSNIAIPMYKKQAIEQNLVYVFKDKNGEPKVRSGDIRNDIQFGGQKPKMSELINSNPSLLTRYRNEIAPYKYSQFD